MDTPSSYYNQSLEDGSGDQTHSRPEHSTDNGCPSRTMSAFSIGEESAGGGRGGGGIRGIGRGSIVEPNPLIKSDTNSSCNGYNNNMQTSSSRWWSRQSLQRNPFAIFALSFLVSWCYAMIPVESYWFYYLVKNQVFVVLCLVTFMEMQELCLMDFPAHLYTYCYMIGFFLPPTIHIVRFFASQEESILLGTFANNLAYLILLLVYIYDVWYFPRPGHKPAMQSGEGAVPIDEDDLSNSPMYDAFTASLTDEDITEALSAHLLDSQCRAGWKQRYTTTTNYYRESNIPPTAIAGLSTASPLASDAAAEGSGGTTDSIVSRSTATTRDAASIVDVAAATKDMSYITAFFFSMLPRHAFLSRGVRSGALLSNRRSQLLLIFVLNTVFSLYFYFIIFFITVFRDKDRSSAQRALIFIIYVSGGFVFARVSKQLGLVLDRRKRGSASMYFIAELSCLLYYYIFYRVLFESLSNWGQFFILEAVHLFSEWCLYPFRSTLFIYKMITRTEKQLVSRGLPSIVSKGLDHSDWLHFIGLEFGIRCTVMISTGVVILLESLTIDFVPWIHNSLKADSRHEMQLNTEVVIAAVALEILNAFVMNKVYFVPNNVSIPNKVKQCFSSPRFAFMSCIAASVLFLNPMYVFSTNSSFS